MGTETSDHHTKTNRKPYLYRHFPTLILMILGLIFFAAATDLNLRKIHAIETRYHALLQTSAQQAKHIETLRTALSRNDPSAMRAQLSLLQKNLIALNQRKDDHSHGWKLAKAHYLIWLANLNLNYEHDPEAATHSLLAASALLRSIPNEDAMNLRQALIDDIATLKQTNPPKIEALYQDIAKLVQTLPTLEFVGEVKVTQPSDTQTARTKTWRDKLRDNVKALKSFVVVRHHDAVFASALTRHEQRQLITSIRFLLEEAQWALLRRNPTIYQTSLLQAQNQLSDYLRKNSHPNQAFLAQLTTLSKVNITLNIALQHSLELINEEVKLEA